MIKDSLKNIDVISKYGDNFKTAADFLKNTELKSLKPGKYEIDSSNVYAFFCEVKLAYPENARLETHRKYADIQVVTEGCEGMQYSPVAALSINTDYNEDSDIAFYDDIDNLEMLKVCEGEFALFMPEDAHKPNCLAGQGDSSKKLIVKVKL